MFKREHRLTILYAVAASAIVATAFIPPIAQPLDYHNFADTRALFGAPNFWNVVSNVPFLLVGAIGLVKVLRGDCSGGLRSQRIGYCVFFASVAAVCFGSGYYHWTPSNETLAWDRLPMAVAFMAFVSIVIGEHISERAARLMLVPLIVLGVMSVWYWDYTEALGRGDLRWYGLVQFLSLVLIALIIWLFRSRLSGIGYLWAMFGGYALAKLLEEFDEAIYAALGREISGHALKHVVAAIGMYFFVLALRRRRAMSDA